MVFHIVIKIYKKSVIVIGWPLSGMFLKGKGKGGHLLEFKFEILKISSPENKVALDIQSLVTWMLLHLARKWTVEEFLNSSSYILGHNSVLLPNKRSRFFSSQVCTTPLFVGSNNSYLISFNNWLAPVAKSVDSLWKRCWRASVDGWAGSTFHSQCNGKGPTVTIIRFGRYVFGGYTSKSWRKCAL